ncbi:PBSX family phage terminase large subunit [Latilactobacillus fragifolii]|uniref:PBSX family phage terminase large subunit n=1 Tax=Latilactobacillus fragifolii TaxID=2814244 RepID=UPI001ABAE5AE|nr:PBSX family phage terminase large subunit [Latilactobacillus fragifolii]
MEISWNLPEMVSSAYAPLFVSHSRIIAYKGSRGSGKSEAMAIKVIYDIVTKPYVNWLVLRRYANTNRQSTFTLIQKVANRMGVSGFFQFNASLPEITYKPTGQKILFRGADKPLSITSISVETGNLCRQWVEEAYQLESEEAYETIEESMRGVIDDPEGFYQTIFTFNPWSERHWLKKRFFDEKTKVDDVLALTTTYKDNPFLDEDYIGRLIELKRRNPRRAKVAVDGEWGVAEGLVFENFVVENFDLTEVLKDAIPVHGLDFGFSHDPTAFAEAAVNLKTKDIYIFNELYKTGMFTKDIFNWLVVNGYQNTTITADCAEDRLIAELRALGIRRINRSKKGKGSIMYGIDFMQGFTIHILPSCVHAAEEFNSYAFSKDKDGNWINKPVDKDNHFIDALRYGLEPLIMPNKNKSDRMEEFKKLGLGR